MTNILNRNRKLILLIIWNILLVLIPMGRNIFSYSSKDVAVDRVNPKLVSVKNCVVSQKFYIEGQIRNFTVTIYAPSGELYGESNVQFVIKQNGQTVVTDEVDTRRLAVESNYENEKDRSYEDYVDEQYYSYSVTGVEELKPGEAIIYISSNNLPDGTDVFCLASETLTSGLPAAYSDNNNLSYPIVIDYKLLLHNKYFYYDIITFAIILLLCVLLVHRLYLDKGINLYVITSLLIFFCISMQSPTATFFAMPRSEAVYEFWYKAHTETFLDNLMSLMSGEAIAWLERLIIWIASKISPVEYVFHVAQIIECLFISLTCSMFTLNAFSRIFSDALRVTISVVLGVYTVFLDAYYFWSVSYWSLIFIFFFTLLVLVDRKKNILGYVMGLCLVAILCCSRIFHIVFVPVVVLTIIIKNKALKVREYILGSVVTVFSLFCVVYSLNAGDNLTGNSSIIENIVDIGVARVIINTLYYQIQFITSFLFGNSENLFFLHSVISASIFLAVFLSFVYFITQKEYRDLACIIGGFGIISLGTIALTVVTAGSYPNVQLFRNYSTEISWLDVCYQEADLHFSYSAFSLVYIISTILYALKKQLNHIKYLEVFYIILFIFVTIVNSKTRETSEYALCNDWSAYCAEVGDESYYMPVNVIYGAAPISLEHNSDTIIIGVDDDGNTYQWDVTKPVYTFTKPYNYADLDCVDGITDMNILALTVNRAVENFNIEYYCVLYDEQGEVLVKQAQANKEYKEWVDFVFDTPVNGCFAVGFETEAGEPLYVEESIQMGVINYDEEI